MIGSDRNNTRIVYLEYSDFFIIFIFRAEANGGAGGGVERPPRRPFVGNFVPLPDFIGFECLLLEDFETKLFTETWIY